MTIVGEVEADPEQGLSPVTSPLARSLIGKRLDDSVTATPGGVKEYEVINLTFGQGSSSVKGPLAPLSLWPHHRRQNIVLIMAQLLLLSRALAKRSFINV